MVPVSRRTVLRSIGGALSATVAGCNQPSNSDKTSTSGYLDTDENPSPTQTTPPTNTSTPTTTNSPTNTPHTSQCDTPWESQLHWRYVTSETRAYEPTVEDATVYFTTQAGVLYAVDTTTGKLTWRHSHDTSINETPIVDANSVYTAGLEKVFAHDLTTGAIQWRFTPPGEGARITANVAADRGLVFVGAAQIPGVNEDYDRTYTRLYAVDSRTGNTEWYCSLPTGPETAIQGLTATDSAVFVLTADNALRRITGPTGDVTWRRQLGGEAVESGPRYRDGRLYSTVSNQLFVVSATNGTLVWRHQGCNGAPGITEKNVFCATDEVLSAFDRTRHRVQWRTPLPMGTIANDSGTRAAAGNVYVPMDREDRNGLVMAYEAASGCRFGQYELQARRPTPVVSTSEWIYFGGLHGKAAMYAVSSP